MRHWLGEDRNATTAFMAESGQPAYRAGQFREWLHKRRVDDFAAMKNLPRDLRETLAAAGQLRTLAECERREAPDGLTAKWLFAAEDGALIESVLIVEKHLSRRTVCVSCMAGCPLGCVFCATGAGGYVRDLNRGEIIEQVYRLDAHARADGGAGVSHVVFMGMGEPLLNIDAVLAAAAAFADPEGMGLSGRHITISTAGTPEGIRRLTASGVNYRLAFSLHAPTQELRERLMPAARRWSLAQTLAAVDEFARSSSRDVTFEYCLIDGLNASPKQAEELTRLLARRRAKVNLIPLNPVPGSNLRPPSPGATRRFQEILEAAGITATVRMEKGGEIGAACGQLRAERAKG